MYAAHKHLLYTRTNNPKSQGTGMAIYFPPNTYSMHRLYAGFVADNDPADLSGWLKFLNDLYAAINLVASTGALDCRVMSLLMRRLWKWECRHVLSRVLACLLIHCCFNASVPPPPRH